MVAVICLSNLQSWILSCVLFICANCLSGCSNPPSDCSHWLPNMLWSSAFSWWRLPLLPQPFDHISASLRLDMPGNIQRLGYNVCTWMLIEYCQYMSPWLFVRMRSDHRWIQLNGFIENQERIVIWCRYGFDRFTVTCLHVEENINILLQELYYHI